MPSHRTFLRCSLASVQWMSTHCIGVSIQLCSLLSVSHQAPELNVNQVQLSKIDPTHDWCHSSMLSLYQRCMLVETRLVSLFHTSSPQSSLMQASLHLMKNSKGPQLVCWGPSSSFCSFAAYQKSDRWTPLAAKQYLSKLACLLRLALSCLVMLSIIALYYSAESRRLTNSANFFLDFWKKEARWENKDQNPPGRKSEERYVKNSGSPGNLKLYDSVSSLSAS